MSVTVTQAIANTREMMDAVGSSRWSDAFITTVLGIVSWREWGGILKAAPMYRFATRAVTSAADGTIPYTALDSGSGNTAQNTYKVISITDGQRVYRQTDFAVNPLAISGTGISQYQSFPQWYEAGTNIQIIPVSAVALNVSVNYRPPRVDILTPASTVIDFPDGRETILWLEAGAYLLSKGGMENDSAQTLRAMADQERTDMYSDLARRSTRPMSLSFPDAAAEWGG